MPSIFLIETFTSVCNILYHSFRILQLSWFITGQHFATQEMGDFWFFFIFFLRTSRSTFFPLWIVKHQRFLIAWIFTSNKICKKQCVLSDHSIASKVHICTVKRKARPWAAEMGWRHKRTETVSCINGSKMETNRTRQASYL